MRVEEVSIGDYILSGGEVAALALMAAVAPALKSEGKKLQNEQSVGMGSNGRAAVSAGVAPATGFSPAHF